MTVRLLQGMYFVVSGIWPLLHMKSFEAVTGPKTDRWLVKTVGVLVSLIGAGILRSGFRRKVSDDIALIAVGSSLALAAIEIYYVFRRRISNVYLLDVPVELTLAALWCRDSLHRSKSKTDRIN